MGDFNARTSNVTEFTDLENESIPEIRLSQDKK